MKTSWKRLVGLVLIVALALGVLTRGSLAHAEEASKKGISKSKTSSEYELSPAKDTTTITLSLSSEEFIDTYDIVFVADGSKNVQLLMPRASELVRSLDDEDLNVNIGVVKFGGRAQDTIDTVSNGGYSALTPLNDETRSYIDEAIALDPTTDPRSTCGNGSNLHSALLKAQQWLDASDTPDNNKYVILLTEGRSYIFDDGNGNPRAIYTQYHRGGITPNRLMYEGRPSIRRDAQADKFDATFSTGSHIFKDADLAAAFDAKIVRFGSIGRTITHEQSVAEFQKLYASTNSELTDPSPYETSCPYIDSGTETIGLSPLVYENVEGWDTYFTPDASLFQNYYAPGELENTPYLELSPLAVALDENTGACSYTGELNPNYWMFHVSSEEKALYLAAHAWTDLGDAYHAIAIYNYAGYNSGLETYRDFMEWLPENSEMAAHATNDAEVGEVFDKLENQIVYTVSKAVVTDEIPSYLDLVEDAYDGGPFQVVVDDDVLTATKTGGSQWAYGANDPDDPPYEVTWDASARTFKFTINVPVKNACAVKLNYQLKWNGTGEEEVDVDTNASTTIEYWPSNDPAASSVKESYKSPKVIYHGVVDYRVTKAWSDSDDEDGIRPESVEVQLYANGSVVGEPVTLTEAGKWTHTWKGLVRNEGGAAIDYEVKEVAVPEGYTAEVEEDASGYEATVTNSHTPETGPNEPKDDSEEEPEDSDDPEEGEDPKPTVKPATKPATKPTTIVKPAEKQKLPTTGDVVHAIGWLVTAGFGAMGTGLYLRRRKDGRKEG